MPSRYRSSRNAKHQKKVSASTKNIVTLLVGLFLTVIILKYVFENGVQVSGKATSQDFIVLDDPDLVAYWNFDDPQANLVLDKSGNGNDGSIIGSVDFVPGMIGDSLLLQGNGHIRVPAEKEDLNLKGNAMTLSYWVKAKPQKNFAYILSKSNLLGDRGYASYTSSVGNTGLSVFFGSFLDGTLLRSKPETSTSLNSPTLWTGTWQHIAFTYDGSLMALYINSQLIASLPFTKNIPSSDNLDFTIGEFNEYLKDTSRPFLGKIDEIAVWKRALSTTEIASLFQQQFDKIPSSENGEDSQLPDRGRQIAGADNPKIKSGNGEMNIAGSMISQPRKVPCEDAPTSDQNPPLAQDPQNPLIAHWNFDELSGVEILDSAGSNTGEMFGDPQRVPGKKGNALNFEGGYKYVQIPYAKVLDVDGEELTISLWTKQLIAMPYKYLISKSDASGQTGYSLYTGPDSTLQFFIGSGNIFKTPVPDRYVWDGSWRHIVGVFNKDNLKLYIDGRLEQDVSSSKRAIKKNCFPLRIGAFLDSSTKYFFEGSIDEVRIYNKALTQEEVFDVFLLDGGDPNAPLAPIRMKTRTPDLSDEEIKEIERENEREIEIEESRRIRAAEAAENSESNEDVGESEIQQNTAEEETPSKG